MKVQTRNLMILILTVQLIASTQQATSRSGLLSSLVQYAQSLTHNTPSITINGKAITASNLDDNTEMAKLMGIVTTPPKPDVKFATLKPKDEINWLTPTSTCTNNKKGSDIVVTEYLGDASKCQFA